MVVTLLLPITSQTVAAESIWPSKDEVRELLLNRADAHGIPHAVAIELTEKCENRDLDPSAIGAGVHYGIGQWAIGRGNHWDKTPAWTELRIDIVTEYKRGNPDALWFDLDMLMWSFSMDAPRGNYLGWPICGPRALRFS